MPAPKPIVLTPYSDQWPVVFQQLKDVYEAALVGLVEGIEHVGSTSVPGLQAKPVIDVDIIIAEAGQLAAVVPRLAALGYHHVGNQGIAGREAFKRTSALVPLDGSGKAWPPHHLYVCPRGSLSLLNHLTFRDYLRSHPQQARAYGQLKEELAAAFPGDMDRYVAGKTPFVLGVLQQLGFEAGSLALIQSQNAPPPGSPNASLPQRSL
ncbi:GrpB family protein [Hymenobacter coalescens]